MAKRAPCEQTVFDGLFRDAEQANHKRIQERESTHLPSDFKTGVQVYKDLIEKLHEAVMRGEIDSFQEIREEAHRLAVKVNGGNGAILAGPEAAGCRLDKRCAAPKGFTPRWGQAGEFEIEVSGKPRRVTGVIRNEAVVVTDTCKVRIEWDGMFGLSLPGFSANVVNLGQPFISFLGGWLKDAIGVSTFDYARSVVQKYVDVDLKGNLVWVDPSSYPGARSKRKGET